VRFSVIVESLFFLLFPEESRQAVGPSTSHWLKDAALYRVIQEDRSVSWEVIVLVILRKKFTWMCLILSSYRNRAV
jgi:hypothetical protein